MDNQEEMQKLQERIDQLVEQICEAWKRIQAALQEVWDAIRIVIQRFTRNTFAVRLIGVGLPAFLAEFIADHLPWRWMPIEWIFSFVV